jgi:hypothetical protein
LLLRSNSELWQRLLRIVVAVRTWCSEPARIKPFRINQFHLIGAVAVVTLAAGGW